jgi:resuscitation-promoting factor RpfA
MRMRTLMSSAVLAAATVTPLVAVTAPSDAATTRTWQRLANCESGGRWHINTGNGYYGGLQISRGTWRGYGGRHFARLPSRATKAQQIRVAERIKRGQGWGAWPACSERIGVR